MYQFHRNKKNPNEVKSKPINLLIEIRSLWVLFSPQIGISYLASAMNRDCTGETVKREVDAMNQKSTLCNVFRQPIELLKNFFSFYPFMMRK